jgi:hypothetical protein
MAFSILMVKMAQQNLPQEAPGATIFTRGLPKVPPFSSRKGTRLRFVIAAVSCYSEGIDACPACFASMLPLVFASGPSSS